MDLSSSSPYHSLLPTLWNFLDAKSPEEIDHLAKEIECKVDVINNQDNNEPPVLYFVLSNVKKHLRKLKEARDYYAKGIALIAENDPCYGHVHAYMAALEARLLNWREAKKHSDKALTAFGHQAPPDVRELTKIIEENLIPEFN